MSNLLDKAKSLSDQSGRRSKWKVRYYDVWVVLIRKGYTGLRAAQWIASQDGLTPREERNLYRAAMYWEVPA